MTLLKIIVPYENSSVIDSLDICPIKKNYMALIYVYVHIITFCVRNCVFARSRQGQIALSVISWRSRVQSAAKDAYRCYRNERRIRATIVRKYRTQCCANVLAKRPSAS